MYQGSEQHKDNAREASKKSGMENTRLRLERIREYSLSPKVCKCCGTTIEYDKRINNFCSKKCSATVNNTNRVISEEQKSKVSIALKGKSSPFKGVLRKERCIGGKLVIAKLSVVPTIPCITCGKSFSPKSKKRKNCSKACHTLYIKTDGYRNLLRENSIRAMAEGKIKPWQSRLGKPASFPEKYFMKLFVDLNISFEREVKCGAFFIDFVIGNYAVEIDGSQHERPDMQERDARKDVVLSENGYEVIRIKWYHPSYAKKHLLHSQITDLLLKIKSSTNTL